MTINIIHNEFMFKINEKFERYGKHNYMNTNMTLKKYGRVYREKSACDAYLDISDISDISNVSIDFQNINKYVPYKNGFIIELNKLNPETLKKYNIPDEFTINDYAYVHKLNKLMLFKNKDIENTLLIKNIFYQITDFINVTINKNSTQPLISDEDYDCIGD